MVLIPASESEPAQVLHAPAQQAQAEIVQFLHGHPAVRVNKLDQFFCTALFHAAASDSLRWNEKEKEPRRTVVQELLSDERVDVNKGNQSPLWRASDLGDEEMVKLLLVSGRDFDVKKKAQWDENNPKPYRLKKE